jgi:D-arabinose 1-dehydrogenase-like Zn-dependent alcohol dehydrogenase
MGFRTVAIGRGGDKEKLAKDLGAHLYIDTAVEDAAARLQSMGGARAILATAPAPSDRWCPVSRHEAS